MRRGESTHPRFFCPVPMAVGQTLALPDALARHAVRSLRLRIDDRLTLFDGNGGEYEARVIRDREPATVAIVAFDPIERESALAITLAQGIAAAERMDLVVQKAVELGVHAIEPVTTSRSVVRLDAERAPRRREHWQQVAIAACEQCGRNRIPRVAAPRDFDPWMRTERPGVLCLVLSTRAAQRLDAALATRKPDRALVLAGPEGGFSDEELRLAARRGFVEVALGPRILRTETAAIVALAVLQALAGDLR